MERTITNADVYRYLVKGCEDIEAVNAYVGFYKTLTWNEIFEGYRNYSPGAKWQTAILDDYTGWYDNIWAERAEG